MPPFLANRDFNCFYKGKVLAGWVNSHHLPNLTKVLIKQICFSEVNVLVAQSRRKYCLASWGQRDFDIFVLVDLDFNNVLAAD